MSQSPFDQCLTEMRDTHRKKSADYASDDDPFLNFSRSSTIVGWFGKELDQVFAALIGTKLARIASLTRDGREPQNESLDDSHRDLAVYATLWWAMRRKGGGISLDLPKQEPQVNKTQQEDRPDKVGQKFRPPTYAQIMELWLEHALKMIELQEEPWRLGSREGRLHG